MGRSSIVQRASLLLLFGSMLGFAPHTAWAEEGESDWGYKLSHDLMSPYCPGRTLAACSSPQAAELREWIVDQEKEGRGEAEVREELYAEFGEILRSAPLPKDGGEWAYLIPIFVILAGGAVVFYFLRRQSSAVAAMTASSGEESAEDPELARIIDREIGA